MSERSLLRPPRVGASIIIAALFASGCLATRGDVEVLQQDIRLVRSETARDDSLRRADIGRLGESLRAVSDSLAALSVRLTRLRAELQGRMSSLEEQTQRAQELAGQSQTRIQEIRASLEQVRSVAPDTGATPGPNQLYQIGREQYARGSNSAARTAFQELLTRYPSSDIAADAQFYVAETFMAEGNARAADSAYAVVSVRFGRSTRAATATYKRGVLAENAGRTADARRLYNEVVARFPRSDEAALARDRLRNMR